MRAREPVNNIVIPEMKYDPSEHNAQKEGFYIMVLYQVMLVPEVVEKYQYLMSDLAQVHVLDSGEKVAHLTCTHVDTSGNYVEAVVSSPPNGEPVRILLNHSFVVAIRDLTNHKVQPGFVHQEESPD